MLNRVEDKGAELVGRGITLPLLRLPKLAGCTHRVVAATHEGVDIIARQNVSR